MEVTPRSSSWNEPGSTRSAIRSAAERWKWNSHEWHTRYNSYEREPSSEAPHEKQCSGGGGGVSWSSPRRPNMPLRNTVTPTSLQAARVRVACRCDENPARFAIFSRAHDSLVFESRDEMFGLGIADVQPSLQ